MTDKVSLSQIKGLPFDWNKFLRVVIENPYDIDYDMDIISTMAGSWITCACGNQCNEIPRDMEGEPYDIELSDLGLMFSNHIRKAEWREAKKVLMCIESRSEYLINQIEIYKKLNLDIDAKMF